jgi:hypothetical protein
MMWGPDPLCWQVLLVAMIYAAGIGGILFANGPVARWAAEIAEVPLLRQALACAHAAERLAKRQQKEVLRHWNKHMDDHFGRESAKLRGFAIDSTEVFAMSHLVRPVTRIAVRLDWDMHIAYDDLVGVNAAWLAQSVADQYARDARTKLADTLVEQFLPDLSGLKRRAGASDARLWARKIINSEPAQTRARRGRA